MNARTILIAVLATGFIAGGVRPAMADYPDLVNSLNPIAYWRFNDPSSAEGAVAADSSINGLHDGLYHNGVALTTTDLPGPGSGGQAASFDGLDDWIGQISDAGFPAGEAERTFTGWVRYEAPHPPAYGAIFWYGNVGYEQMYSVAVFNSNDLYTANNAVGVTNYGGSVGTDPLLDGEWHFVAFTCSNSNHRVYLDGEFVREKILWTNTVLSSQAYISDPTQGDSYFRGSMDELAFFDKVLSDQDIRDLYHTIPEPAALALLGLGGLALLRRRRFARRVLPLVLIAVCLCGAGIGAAQAGVIDGPVTNPANGHFYYLLDHSLWTEAEAAAVGMGGHLTAINDQAENDWVYDAFGYIVDDTHQLWIGLHDVGDFDWAWTTGEPVTYLNWYPGEPNFPGEDYTIMWGYPGYEGTWNNTLDDNWYPVHGNLTYGVVEVIPEPVALSLLGLGGLALLKRKGKSCRIRRHRQSHAFS